MSNKPNSISGLDQTNIYKIRVEGHLDRQWSDWFDDLTITPDVDGTTLITGPVADDAALHGLLKRVRDSGLRLLSVNRVKTDQEEVVSGHSDESTTEQEEILGGAE